MRFVVLLHGTDLSVHVLHITSRSEMPCLESKRDFYVGPFETFDVSQ